MINDYCSSICRSLPRVLQPLTSSSDQRPGKSRNNSPRSLTLRVLTTLHKWILVWLCSGRWGLLISTFWCNFCSMNGLLVMLLHWWGILLYSSLSTSHTPPSPPTASFFSLFPYAFLYPRVERGAERLFTQGHNMKYPVRGRTEALRYIVRRGWCTNGSEN